MSAAASTTTTLSEAAASRPRGWLFGPVPDLLLGCGLAYALVLGALGVFGTEVREGLPAGALPFLSVLIGAPHYGATLLRVYEQRTDRRAYALFAVHATALLAILFVAATQWMLLGSLLLTVYLTWSPWHYTGQNYGLAILFLRRRGVPVDPMTKRSVYLAFVLSYAAVFVAIHSDALGSSYAPQLYPSEGYRMLSLHVPPTIGAVLFDSVLLGYVLAMVVAALRLLSRGSAVAVAPALLLLLTQALWFSIPVAVRRFGLLAQFEPFSAQYATWYFFWVALGHSIQYVWVTSYFARNSAGYSGMNRYLGKALLAGTAIWGVPALLFAPDLLGRLPFDAGLGVLVAAVVNLHHFILDGAIWKLRDGRIARVLLRSGSAASSAPAESGRRLRPLRASLFAMGAVSLGVMLASFYESELNWRRARQLGDVERMQAALERLDWLGRESAVDHLQMGRTLASRGDTAGALREYERSLALYATSDAWLALAKAHERGGDFARARAAFDRALAMAPLSAPIAYHAAILAGRTGDLSRAQTLLEESVRLDPNHPRYRAALARTRELAGGLAPSGAAAP